MAPENVKEFLLEKADRYEEPDFLPKDPLSIPHRYTDQSDVEVAAFSLRPWLGATACQF